jgi:alkylhydroperoxidase/carboxymuconolactone decarboxylase family protein YurZ
MSKIYDQEYGRVKEFKYLGTIWTEDNDITTGIKHQITIANKTSYGLKKQLNSIEFETSD